MVFFGQFFFSFQSLIWRSLEKKKQEKEKEGNPFYLTIHFPFNNGRKWREINFWCSCFFFFPVLQFCPSFCFCTQIRQQIPYAIDQANFTFHVISLHCRPSEKFPSFCTHFISFFFYFFIFIPFPSLVAHVTKQGVGEISTLGMERSIVQTSVLETWGKKLFISVSFVS